MSELICDEFRPCREDMDSRDSRLRYGIPMHILIGAKFVENDKSSHDISMMTCCQSVRDTSQDWQYLIPLDLPKELVDNWLEELRAAFPRFEFVTSKIKHISYKSHKLLRRLTILGNLSYDSKIKSSLPFKEGIINVYKLDFINLIFLYYCWERDIVLFKDNIFRVESNYSKEDLGNLVKNFLIEWKDKIIEEFHNPEHYCVDPSYLFGRNIQLSENIDFDKLPNFIGNLKQNIVSTFMNRYNVLQIKAAYDYLQGYISKDYTITLVNVLYSKKLYTIEAYLAHILFRALYSEETRDFINQYFKIKDKTPDLYFWNRIFLTQFGFRFYYYYWLTDGRFFKLTNKEDFTNKIKNFKFNSSLQFFEDNFSMTIPKNILIGISKEYSEGNLNTLLNNMKELPQVSPTEKFKAKSKFFKYSDKYSVIFMLEDYYYIRNDQFYIRKYKKTNFNIVEE